MKTIIILTIPVIPVLLSRVFFNPRKPEQGYPFDIFICYTADYFMGFTADFDGNSVSLNTDFKLFINNINELQKFHVAIAAKRDKKCRQCPSAAPEHDCGGRNGEVPLLSRVKSAVSPCFYASGYID